MCTGTTRTCGNTCACGAGTHGDVLNLHTEVFWTDTRGRRGRRRERRGRVTVSSANHETAHIELSRASERFTERNPWFLPTQGLRTGREQHVPESSNHSLYLMKLLRDTAEGIRTHNTHIRTNTYSPTHPPTDPPPLPFPPYPPSPTRARTRKRTCTCTCICTCSCICVCACVCVCVCFCVRTCICL